MSLGRFRNTGIVGAIAGSLCGAYGFSQLSFPTEPVLERSPVVAVDTVIRRSSPPVVHMGDSIQWHYPQLYGDDGSMELIPYTVKQHSNRRRVIALVVPSSAATAYSELLFPETAPPISSAAERQIRQDSLRQIIAREGGFEVVYDACADAPLRPSTIFDRTTRIAYEVEPTGIVTRLRYMSENESLAARKLICPPLRKQPPSPHA